MKKPFEKGHFGCFSKLYNMPSFVDIHKVPLKNFDKIIFCTNGGYYKIYPECVASNSSFITVLQDFNHIVFGIDKIYYRPSFGDKYCQQNKHWRIGQMADEWSG
jgi:hypothetical protein